MKKFASAIVAFIIVWAVTFGLLCLAGYIMGDGHLSDRSVTYFVIGFAGALGGLLGPKVADLIQRRIKRA